MNRTLIGLGLAATVTLAGCTQAAPTASPTAVPTAPATTAPATAAPSAPTTTAPKPAPSPVKPAPSPAAPTLQGPETMILPADKGTAFREITLPREKEEAIPEEMSAFEPRSFPLSCLDGKGIQPKSLALLTDSRVRERSIPEGSDIDGLVMFTDEDAAHAFMVELRAAYAACAPIGPESANIGTADDPIHERSRMATDPQAAPGVEAFSMRVWTERKIDGDWHEAPGGDVTLFARDGRYVAFSGSGGEYVGDSVEELEPGAMLHGTVADLLAVV